MRRALTAVPVLLLAGMLALATAVPAFAESTRHHGSPADVTVIGVNLRGHEQRGHHFAADKLSSLVLRVHWKTLVGLHSQRLELIAPDGAVYQTLVDDVGDVHGQAFAETRVPVVGSWITQYGLFGEWHVKVYLDEATTPVTTAKFTLAR
jgi:hypothetical protein